MRSNVVWGEVLDIHRQSTNYVWGTNGQTYSAVSSSTDLFIRETTGRERRIYIDSDVSARSGHRIAAVYLDAGNGPELAALYNRSIDETWAFAVGKARGLKNFAAGTLLLTGAAVLLLGSALVFVCVSNTMQYVNGASPRSFAISLGIAAWGLGLIMFARRLRLSSSPAAAREVRAVLGKLRNA